MEVTSDWVEQLTYSSIVSLVRRRGCDFLVGRLALQVYGADIRGLEFLAKAKHKRSTRRVVEFVRRTPRSRKFAIPKTCSQLAHKTNPHFSLKNSKGCPFMA